MDSRVEAVLGEEVLDKRFGTLVQREIIAVVSWTRLPISRELGASGVFLKLSGATTLSPPLQAGLIGGSEIGSLAGYLRWL
jgi:hypothetical protein